MTYGITNAGGGKSAELGTKSITANGTYSASTDNLDGYSEVTVNVPAQLPTVTAINISGSAVTAGDKVFLNEFSREPQAEPSSWYGSGARPWSGHVSPDGFYYVGVLDYQAECQKLYKWNDDGTNSYVMDLDVSAVYGSLNNRFTIKDGLLILYAGGKTCRCDNNTWSVDYMLSMDCGYCWNFSTNTIAFTVYEFDLATGTVGTAYTGGITEETHQFTAAYIGNDTLVLWKGDFFKVTLDRVNHTYSYESLAHQYNNAVPICTWVKNGNAYLLFKDTYTHHLRILDVTNKSISTTLPDDLSRFNNVTHLWAYYNHDTRNLVVTHNDTQEYGVFHISEDGVATELNVNITVSGNFIQGVTLSSDLSRATWLQSGSTKAQTLTAITGYTAATYSQQKAGSATSTGVVQTGGSAGSNVTVATILPDEVTMTMNSPDTLSSFRVNGEEI